MNGDVLRTVAEARPDELDPGVPVDAATRERELTRAMAGAPRAAGAAGLVRGPARRRRVGPAWGMSLGLLGAAAAVAVGVATTSGGGDGSGHGKRPVPPSAGGEIQAQPMSARTVLLSAATSAEKQSNAVGGAFWHQTTVQRDYSPVGKGPGAYVIVSTQRAEGWAPATTGPKARQWSRQQNLGSGPATAKDKAAWARAGSPSKFEVSFPSSPKGGKLKNATLNAAPGKVEISSSALPDGDKIFWLGRNVTMKDLRGLPTTPKQLKASLLKWYGGHDTESDSIPMASDDWLQRVAGGMITDMPITPQVRAAAFRMLAGLDSVKAVGPVKDAEGRTGTALVSVEKTRNGVLEHRLIIDEAKGVALGSEVVILKPGGVNALLPAGTRLQSTSIVGTDWTDAPPN
ncbi:CU044_5270 family protein [Actinomadura barringtoniae]|uniref:CU044_5270 family protein n=1 Tax=Actinomadura barringtoniae TaxID=1427535 RepID=A0A939T562_9ACTN|nr:CU044_5270 family protein [Actinomadura barringtoniae]MBO2449139.1 CU044_5270 family protein [Actinomadura barringtoniae]